MYGEIAELPRNESKHYWSPINEVEFRLKCMHLLVSWLPSRSLVLMIAMTARSILSLTLPSGKDQLRGLIVTRLKVTVSLRRENHVVWTGQATTVRASGTRTGDPSVVATALSDALLTWFPRQLPGPLSVP
jgi:hypothetical protein